jgi:sugar phosphate isomerase/epimerase
MKVGVSTASLFLRKNNEDALPLFNALGVKTAEVFLTTYSEYGKEFAEKLKKVQKNVQVNSVHVLNTQFEPQLFSSHERAKEDAFFWLDKTLESAKILNAPFYTFHGLARVKKASRSGKYDDFSRLIKGFQEITARCEKQGVHLALENVEWSTYNRVGVFSRIAKEVETLRGVLDIKQARISGEPYENYLAEMGEKLAYVHISDIDEQGKMCLPMQGTFDFETLIRRLKDAGFNGALLIEAYANDYQKEKELKTACDKLEELLYKFSCL